MTSKGPIFGQDQMT